MCGLYTFYIRQLIIQILIIALSKKNSAAASSFLFVFLISFCSLQHLAQDALLTEPYRATLLIEEGVHVIVIPLECVEKEIDRRIRVPSLRIWDETSDAIKSGFHTHGAITAHSKTDW